MVKDEESADSQDFLGRRIFLRDKKGAEDDKTRPIYERSEVFWYQTKKNVR